MSTPTIHTLLRYQHHNEQGGQCCALLWDMHNPPHTASHIAAPDRPLSAFDLAQHATSPPVTLLRITCGIYPESAWVSEARNWLGVTVQNVLDAIYDVLCTQIEWAEWMRLCTKQQDRVNVVFDTRWRSSPLPDQIRARGVLRIDTLLQHIRFGGLSMSLDEESTCLMSLRRPKR